MYKSLGDNWKKWAVAAAGLKCQQQIFKLPTVPSFLSILYRCWIIPSARSRQDIIMIVTLPQHSDVAIASLPRHIHSRPDDDAVVNIESR